MEQKADSTIPNHLRYFALAIFVTVNFFDSMEYSIQAPFYPAEAEKKNATSTEYGIVFGIFELVVFLFCPIIPKLLETIGFFTIFHSGLAMVGVCSILFGFLDRVNDRTWFISLSMMLRIIEAIGACMTSVASYSLIVSYFPSSTATIFSILETSFALGNAVGPSIGGFLFELGGKNFGFTLPFLVLGVTIVLLIPPSCFTFLPEKNSRPPSKSEGFGFFSLLRIPVILLYALNVSVASLAVGFLLAILEPHIRQFNLTPSQVGLVFLSYAGAYASTAALWGLLCDRIKRPEYALVASTILMTIGFIWIGPLSFIPYETQLWLTVISLFCFGLGQAGTFVSTFLLMMKGGKQSGHSEDELAPYVSSLWLSSLCLGAFIGPSLAGVLYQYFGFRQATIFVVVIFKILIILSIITLVFPKILQRSRNLGDSILSHSEQDEKSPLLTKSV